MRSLNEPQSEIPRLPWEGGISPDPTSWAKIIHTLVIPLGDGRLKSLAMYKKTTHPKEFYWSEDKVITYLVGPTSRNHLNNRVLIRPARLWTVIVGALSPTK